MKQEYGKVKIEWTEEKIDYVKNRLMKYFNKYEGYCGETIQQDDDCIIYAPYCLGDIADVLFEDIEIYD